TIRRVVRTTRIHIESKVTTGRVECSGGVETKCILTDCSIVEAGRVAVERIATDGCVFKAGGVVIKGVKTIGGIVNPDRITKERAVANRCVRAANRVVIKRIKSDCRVKRAVCKAKKGIDALGGIVTRIASIRWRVDRFRDNGEPNWRGSDDKTPRKHQWQD